MPPTFPLVSIVISCYNYARYVGAAIDSALGQTYPQVEVIVVDDGSRDESRSVIEAFGGQITAYFQDNGGQAKALNRGFAACNGEIVIFLDADDSLCPDTAAAVVDAFRADPTRVRVQFRLAVIDAAGRQTGAGVPAWGRSLPSGDLRRQVLTHPDDLLWQPTSGNAFAAWMLRCILPMPEDAYRICADYYLSNLSPLFGRIGAVDRVLGYYRVHGDNNHAAPALSLEQRRALIRRTLQTHRYLQQAATLVGLPSPAESTLRDGSATLLAHRLVSVKSDPDTHPVSGDASWRLLWRGAQVALSRSDRPLPTRLLHALGFVALWLAPAALVEGLAEQML